MGFPFNIPCDKQHFYFKLGKPSKESNSKQRSYACVYIIHISHLASVSGIATIAGQWDVLHFTVDTSRATFAIAHILQQPKQYKTDHE